MRKVQAKENYTNALEINKTFLPEDLMMAYDKTLALKVHIGDRVKGNNSGIALVNAVQSSPRGWSIETLDQNRRLITNNAKASIPSGDAFKSTHTSLAKSQSALLNQDRVSGHASV
ncbi:hypothetical protein T4B_4558 [Trichinella pseudospiralis]|uniref:Uncharacterized protein n=1 Tax=Trichinella pseudospiralis TaxID=6337 RepID=A0A0V1IUT0_TRIPS|nr:hypothetical protein T4B_4558 [Trichinella pseudospiralis]